MSPSEHIHKLEKKKKRSVSKITALVLGAFRTVGISADMATETQAYSLIGKTHYVQRIPKWHRNDTKKPWSQKHKCLKGMDSKHSLGTRDLPRSTRRAWTPRPLVHLWRRPGPSPSPKRSVPRSQREAATNPLTCLHHSPHAWEMCSCPRCLGQALLEKSKAQTQTEAQAVCCSSGSSTGSGSQRHPGLCEGSRIEAFCFPVWGWMDWCDPQLLPARCWCPFILLYK